MTFPSLLALEVVVIYCSAKSGRSSNPSHS